MSHFHAENRRARKPHRCQLCRRTIRPGETYRHGAGMDGSTAWTWKECAHCDILRDLARWDDTYDDDLIAEWDPETVAQLRLKAMWRRKWTRTDGTLMPIPERIWNEDQSGFRWVVDVTPTLNVPPAGSARGPVVTMEGV